MPADTLRSTSSQEKLKPTPAQERQRDAVLRHACALYNVAREQRVTAWERSPGSVRRAQQAAELKDIRAQIPHYAASHSQVLPELLARLDPPYQAFFRRLGHGAKPGFPCFQGQQRWHRVSSKASGTGAWLDTGCLVLSTLGRLAVQWPRPIDGVGKTGTVSREADGWWYVLFSCAEMPRQPLSLASQETGIDVDLKVLLITSQGESVDPLPHDRQAKKALAKAQRRVTRRKRGSKRRNKARKLLAKKHLKVRRQRQDFYHKKALVLVRRYDVIYLEDLRVRNLVRNRHLAKSISDAGWSQVRTTLEYKAAWAGKQVIAVEPASTSQDCGGCGERIQKSLSVRSHVCAYCGLVMDRDDNAAKNILWRGQRLRGVAA